MTAESTARAGRNNFLLGLIGGIVAMLLTGCSAVGSYHSTRTYDLPVDSKIATAAVRYEGMARNPVIVIHGFLGSRLNNVRTGEDVWGTFPGTELLETASRDQLRQMSHPMGYGKSLKELQGDVVAVGLLDRVKVQLLGLTFYLDAYDRLIDILEDAGYQLEGKPLPEEKHFYSLFVFYYDWRRDLPENAARFHRFILEKQAYMQREYEKNYNVRNAPVKFDIVAHSMGGLLARYYLMYGDQDLPADRTPPVLNWTGSEHINKMILVGTPNAGYLDTCLELVDGLQVAPGTPSYPPALLGTYPSYYQMLPPPETRSVLDARHPDGPAVDLFDPQVWMRYRWGLADPDQDDILQILLPSVKSADERRKIALDHLTKCLDRARRFAAAMKVHGTPPAGVSLFLFLGDSVPTRRTAVVYPDGELKVTEYEKGDGKVLASSALFDEREGRPWQPFLSSPIPWTSIMYLNTAHMGITSSRDFANNVTSMLLDFPLRQPVSAARQTPASVHP